MSIPMAVVLDDWCCKPGTRTAWARVVSGCIQVTADTALLSDQLIQLTRFFADAGTPDPEMLIALEPDRD